MSFSFFKPSKSKSPAELVKAGRESLLALDGRTVADAKLLEKICLEHSIGKTDSMKSTMAFVALEEVDKNLLAMRQMLLGDGETEPNSEQMIQLALEICKDDFLELLVQKLPLLGWDARKDLVHIWTILLKLKTGSGYCCLYYLENHTVLLDFLVSCYENKDIALNSGSMLRECVKYPKLAQYMLESPSFELFFKYIEVPNFDIASDAFITFKELLTKHETLAAAFLDRNYVQFFELYERLLSSKNYVTKRQSLKLLSDFLLERPNAAIMLKYISEVQNLKTMMTLLKDPRKNIQASAFHIFKVFVANPKKPRPIISLLLKNREKLVDYLENLHFSKEDEQFVEEKDLLIKELKGLQQPTGS